ncbi:hypothetical protein CLAFUW4_20045 [Fulvia fulva]|uniref:uncharacterized protein n=1 Tax=Passalora fulva TaxID=5499 RepID=UPI0028529E77|nr:uncharacterized protein CLAFUR5_20045 [Fulvia fulva]KAK4623614.1 hypothetical protein CLAFUR4_20045 [Fulvia fulva]KAK4625312.1 hypothetical protein CLAFUR0_20045 [Fulvia fulva]WMI38902.1 hypothetical protein CLAFUR5_20045 [Fulvia fulva]WPV14534.1 hypothetical protein CLAFUW4_20045 [Fulvia fulva]WPV30568.1 hypothetical protein CLAFUW7_20045 [Fulvia fulva]
MKLLSTLTLLTTILLTVNAQSGKPCSTSHDRPYCDKYVDSYHGTTGNAVYMCIDGRTKVTLNCGNCACIDFKTEAMCAVRPDFSIGGVKEKVVRCFPYRQTVLIILPTRRGIRRRRKGRRFRMRGCELKGLGKETPALVCGGMMEGTCQTCHWQGITLCTFARSIDCCNT